MRHVSFDIETMGNTPLAPIVQIGACVFDREGIISDEFEVTVDPNTLTKYGDDFKMDYSTMVWWLNQSTAAQQSVFADRGLSKASHESAMKQYATWCGMVQRTYGGNNTVKHWSHATFDPPITTRNFKIAGLKPPVHFKSFMDIRTLDFITGYTVRMKRTGVHHNALDDAKFQAQYIAQMLREVL